MKLVKNLLKILAVLVVLFLAAAIAIPYFMKDQIVEVIKEEANKAVNAKIDFKDVELSLLRNFPSLSLHLDDLTVDGINEFEDVRLFGAPSMDLVLDFWKVWGNMESIPIEGFTLESPEVNVLVLKDGRANWDIAKPSEVVAEPTESTDFLVEMEKYAIKNGQITYDDRSMDLQMEIKDLNHSGSGDFSANVFDLDTKTSIAALTATMEGMTYLRKAKADLAATLNVNVADLIITLKDNVLNLNELTLKAEGMIDMNDAAYVMDLKFSSPQNSFKNLWSIIPAAYTADYADAKIDGNMTLNGFAKGTYNDKGSYPAFAINTLIENGSVQYPDLPMGLKAIFTDISVKSPSSNFDDVVVRIPQFEFKLGNNPFAGNFNLRKPISDPTLKTELRGTLNLADINKAIPIEGIKDLAGIINADFYVNAAMSQMDKAQYDAIDMRGTLAVSDIIVEQDGMPKVTIKSLNTDFSPQRIKFDDFDANLGQSDIRASGRIFNILAYFSPDKTMDGSFVVESNYFNANEWIPEEVPAETGKVGFVSPPPAPNNEPRAVFISNKEEEPVFDRFNFSIDGKINKLDYDVYKMSDLVFDGTINPKRTKIDKFYTKIGESDIGARGSVNNLIGYAMNNETLTGDIDIASNYLDLNQFMVETTEEEVPLEIIPIPDNVDLRIDADLKKVRYTNFDLKNIKGAVLVKENVASMKGVKGDLLGGSVKFDAAYDTKDLSKPTFDMQTDLKDFSFKNAFTTFNTFEQLAPLGKFIDGKFNTKLSMNGILGQDMMPDLSSFNMSGFFHTLEAVINGFLPLQQLSDKLGVDKIKTLKIRDSKNWMEVKDGFVEIKEFEQKVDDMAFKIKGKYGLTQEMAFDIKAKIPRALLEKSKVTAAANSGWNFLSGQAAKRGINLANGDFINLKIDVTGSMLAPKFSIIPVSADGETSVQEATKEAVKAAVTEAVDSVKTVAKEKIDAAKEEAQAIRDSITNAAKQKAEEAKEEAKIAAKAAAKNALDSLAKGGKVELPKIPLGNAGEILKDTTINKQVDKAKDKLKNLFGRKKGGGK